MTEPEDDISPEFAGERPSRPGDTPHPPPPDPFGGPAPSTGPAPAPPPKHGGYPPPPSRPMGSSYGGPAYPEPYDGPYGEQRGDSYAPPGEPYAQSPGGHGGAGPYGGRYGGGYGPQAYPGQGNSAGDDRTWAVLAYLGQFVCGFIAPLIAYLVQRDRSPFVRFHGAQALNLALTQLIVTFAAVFIGLLTLGFGLILTLPVLLALGITHLVYLILAAVRAGRGEAFAIPAWLCWPMVR